MQIGRLIVAIESQTAGYEAGLNNAVVATENFNSAVSNATASVNNADYGGKAGEDAAAAANAAIVPMNQLQRTIAAANGEADQSAGAMGTLRRVMGDIGLAAGAVSGGVTLAKEAIRAVQFVRAARGASSLAAAFQQVYGDAQPVAASATRASGAVDQAGDAARRSGRSFRSMLPSVKQVVGALAAAGAAYGLYRSLRAVIGIAGKAKRALGAVVREVILLRSLRAGIASLVSGAFGPLGLAIGSVAGGLAGIAGVGAAVGWGVKLSAEAETARVAFTTLTGSAEAARATMEELAQFAATTPFDTVDVQEAGRKLLAYGRTTDALGGDLAVLGDIAAGTGKPLRDLVDIYGRVGSTGRVEGEILNRLLERGIPITKALASTMNVAEGDIRKMVSEGKVGFVEFQKALESTTKAGGIFAGGMVAQSKTLAGMWSTLTSNFRDGFREAFEGVTAAFNISGLLQEITHYISAGAEVLKEYAVGWRSAAGEGFEWGSIVTRAVGWVGAALGTTIDTVQTVGVAFLRMGATAGDAMASVVRSLDSMAMATAMAANVIPGVEASYSGFLGRIADEIDATTGKVRGLADAMASVKPGEGVRDFFADMQEKVDAARAGLAGVERDALKLGENSMGSPDGKSSSGTDRNVGSLERGTQEAFAAISNRMRGGAGNDVGKNTGKMAQILARMDQREREQLKAQQETAKGVARLQPVTAGRGIN
ncbi:tape measure protein [Alienimonas sp. DA493]|uniref:tape measure protein n=1 Tax=Alienimonas sp. DA493 TaxID=3373605 RepID=UPI003754CC3D